MLIILSSLLLQAVSAVLLPPPTGPYHVGYKQHVFNHTTPNDPVAPANASSILMATIYYPALEVPYPGNNTAPYLDPTTANLWGSILQYPNNSLQTLITWNVLDAPPLEKPTLKPTVIFSPGGGENAIMYNALNADLASQGYTVVALDHPGDAPFIQLPAGGPGIYGLDITYVWPAALQTAVYHMRVSDMLAVARDLWPAYVASTNTSSFNATHFLAIGHSLGGAASAGAAAVEPRILGGVNLDGAFFAPPDVQKPFLMIAGAEHTDALDPSWAPFAAIQTGWYQWVNVTGTGHQDFSDLGDWVDVQGLRGKTITPSLGAIWGPRMDFVVRTFVERFFGYVVGGDKWASGWEREFPEVVYVNGSVGTY
jgi:pimeloyl-ACP methyl ester carboxylesterase